MSDLIVLILVSAADSTAALFAFFLLESSAGALVPPGADGRGDRAGGGVIHLLDPETLVKELDAAVRDRLGLLGAGLDGEGEALDPGGAAHLRHHCVIPEASLPRLCSVVIDLNIDFKFCVKV